MPCGYNSQAAVDIETMLIVATDVSQQTNDKQQIEPMLVELNKLPESLGQADALLAALSYRDSDQASAQRKRNTASARNRPYRC